MMATSRIFSGIKALAGTIVFVLAGSQAAVAQQSAEPATLVVPITSIYPGDAITPEMLQAKTFRYGTGAAQAFAQGDTDIAGKVAKRTLLRGQPIPKTALREADVVVQGRTYTLLFKSAYLTVSGHGVPLQSAPAGMIINVRNPDTGVVVKAKVGPSQVLIVEEQ